MNAALPSPLDVRLMNLTASVVFVACALLVLAAGTWWALRHPAFAIGRIVVQGELVHNNAVTLRANVAPQLVGNFFTIQLGAARAAFEQVPWVRSAQVRREFPRTLHVVLQEHHAVAHWGSEADTTLVNNFGEVFEANGGEIEQDSLPRLSGPTGSAAKVLAMQQTLQPHFAALNLTIEQLDMTPHGGWRVRLDTEGVIELGSGTMEQVLARTDQFLKTLTQVVTRYGRTPEALETADLRHEDGYAIRLRGVSTMAADAKNK